jgi:hypothetical protein
MIDGMVATIISEPVSRRSRITTRSYSLRKWTIRGGKWSISGSWVQHGTPHRPIAQSIVSLMHAAVSPFPLCSPVVRRISLHAWLDIVLTFLYDSQVVRKNHVLPLLHGKFRMCGEFQKFNFMSFSRNNNWSSQEIRFLSWIKYYYVTTCKSCFLSSEA